MTALEQIPGIDGYIRGMVESGHKTHEEISKILQDQYPAMRGLSSRSVKRYCHTHNIHATSRLSKPELTRVVATAVSQVYAY